MYTFFAKCYLCHQESCFVTYVVNWLVFIYESLEVCCSEQKMLADVIHRGCKRFLLAQSKENFKTNLEKPFCSWNNNN